MTKRFDGQAAGGPVAEEIIDVCTGTEKRPDENGYAYPPLPPVSCEFTGSISAFGFSQQGSSHKKRNVLCQDRCGLRAMKDKGLVLAAIADGVGSCEMSDLGAERAVLAALNYMEKEVTEKDFELTSQNMGRVLRGAMHCAENAVNRLAAEMKILPYAFQSTLTISLYDGKDIYFGHAGDDGIVVLTENGACCLITIRFKGETASSVYPLQAGESFWQFGMVKDIAAFIMATDGVLDSFVRGDFENNRVYYPFIEPAFTKTLKNLEEVRSFCGEWEEYMAGDKYRSIVTDDLTFVCVNNQMQTAGMYIPTFDMAGWNADSERFREMRRRILKTGGPEDGNEVKKPHQTGANAAGIQPTNDRKMPEAGAETVRPVQQETELAEKKRLVPCSDFGRCPGIP